MDALLPLLCLLVGMAVPVALIALVLRRARRQLTTAGAYREVAQALGLQVDTRGVSLHGVREGRTLWIGEVLVGEGAERHTEVHGVVGFRRPLALDVGIRRRRGRREASLPLPTELARVLVASAAWPEGLARLLNPATTEALRVLVERCPDLRVSDRHVRVRLRRPPHHASALGSLVEQLEGAAEALERARAAGPPPPATDPWIEAWIDVAERRGLAVAPALPLLSGDLVGWPCEVGPVVRGGVWRARATVTFTPDEDTGLWVGPQQPGTPAAAGQDIRVGDQAFDAAFVVKGHDPDGVRERLEPGVRAGLLRLLDWGEVYLDDHRLMVDGLDPGPDAIDAVLDQLARLTAALSPVRLVRSGTPGISRPRAVDVSSEQPGGG